MNIINMLSKSIPLRKKWFISSKSSVIEEHYVFAEELRRGSYGKDLRGVSKEDQRSYSIKVTQKNRVDDFKLFKKEVKYLKELDHPNIPNIYEIYETDRLCYIVSEHCSGESLIDRIVKENTLTEQTAAIYTRKILSAISHCHKNSICHRDMRPENVIFTSKEQDSDLKITNFGLAKSYTQDELLYNMCGTPYFIAPEMIQGRYGELVDCWSVGVILYIMLGGAPPFNGQNSEEILLNILDSSWAFSPANFASVSDLAKDLICKLLVKNPDIRLTAKDAFKHPWITGKAPVPFAPLSIELIRELESFVSLERLKRAVMMYIASRLDEERLKEVKEVFNCVDEDGDGLISRKEFTEGLFMSRIAINQEQLDLMWDYIDSNENGRIDYIEFISACLHKICLTDKGLLKTAFEFFDLDNNGYITVDELKRTINDHEVRFDISNEAIQNMIIEADTDKDGKINYQEFLNLMYSGSES